MSEIRKCDFYCKEFTDVGFYAFCKKDGEMNLINGDCRYNLKPVSEKRIKELNSELEKEIEFGKKVRENSKGILGAHRLKIVT
jgi:hypothetical protein